MSISSKRPTKSTNPKIPPRAHATFAKFQAAREALGAFTTKHSDLLDQYLMLKSNLEAAEADAKAAYLENREALGDTYAGFAVATKRELNLEALWELRPELKDLATVKVSLTLAEFDKLVNQGIVDDEIYDQVIATNYNIKAPK